MIILNIDLGTDLEREFYDKIRDRDMNYLQYVETLIINDLKENDKNEDHFSSYNVSEDGEENPSSNY